MYHVYGSPKNRTFRVLWALEELEQPYEFTDLHPRSEQIAAMNPNSKVPVLKDGDNILTDSAAILAYLADKHAALTHPAGTVERAHQDAWTQRILDELESLLWSAARHSFVLPEEQRVPEIKPSLRWEFERNITRVAEQFEGPYLMGDTFTVADIIAIHTLTWAVGAKFAIEQENMRAYIDRCRARPAYKRAQSA